MIEQGMQGLQGLQGGVRRDERPKMSGRYAVYLFYWYKSTNPDAAGEQVGVGEEREGSVRRAPSVGGDTTVAAVRARCVTYADVC